ncbi:hypothetical protein [Ralstonia wenshanensis]|uniref:hypothetical protein n=1 Tax=Ralstonia wenshanensis TaxID=2842456 RepID=UPI002AAEFBC9|nr:hypothetical protein [Ralstonia wenshanensis]MDY7507267.1 hypothetical protein [Ralstonia wenshanensis]
MNHRKSGINVNRRRWLQSGGVLVASSVLAACGGGSDASEAAVGSSPSTPTPPSSSTPPSPSNPPSLPQNTIAASVSFAPVASPAVIDSSFAGISVEKSNLSFTSFSVQNANLVAAFNLLKPSVLRIGGNSTDGSSWQPLGADTTKGVITRKGVDRLAAFAQVTGWKVIYGINMVSNDPGSVVDEATYVATALGDSLLGFELGNEPDLYGKHGQSPATYGAFKALWEQYASDIRASLPSAVFTGPATASDYKNFTVPFAADEQGSISILTQHNYRDPATGSIDAMLQPDPKLAPMLQVLQQASGGGLQYRITEANSYYSGGKPGVSDAHASALWALNFMFTVASYGCRGVNFHTGTGSYYSPIAFKAGSGQVLSLAPEYYGIYLFRQASDGALMESTLSTDGKTLSAYAVQGADGGIAVFLVNIDSSFAYQVQIACPPKVANGLVMTLSGPSLDSLSGTQINGATIPLDSAWTPPPSPSVAVKDGQLTVSVPPAGAVMVKIS